LDFFLTFLIFKDDHIFSSTTEGIPSSNEFSAISLEDRQQTRSRHSTNATTANSTVKASLHDKVIEKVFNLNIHIKGFLSIFIF